MTTQDGTTRAVTERFFDRLAAGDIAAAAALCADPIDWYIPGNETLAPWVGKRSRRSEVQAYFEELTNHRDLVRAEVHPVLVDGEVAIVSGEFAARMRKTGKLYESMFFAHITVREGRIVRYHLLEDTYGLTLAMSE